MVFFLLHLSQDVSARLKGCTFPPGWQSYISFAAVQLLSLAFLLSFTTWKFLWVTFEQDKNLKVSIHFYFHLVDLCCFEMPFSPRELVLSVFRKYCDYVGEGMLVASLFDFYFSPGKTPPLCYILDVMRFY